MKPGDVLVQNLSPMSVVEQVDLSAPLECSGGQKCDNGGAASLWPCKVFKLFTDLLRPLFSKTGEDNMGMFVPYINLMNVDEVLKTRERGLKALAGFEECDSYESVLRQGEDMLRSFGFDDSGCTDRKEDIVYIDPKLKPIAENETGNEFTGKCDDAFRYFKSIVLYAMHKQREDISDLFIGTANQISKAELQETLDNTGEGLIDFTSNVNNVLTATFIEIESHVADKKKMLQEEVGDTATEAETISSPDQSQARTGMGQQASPGSGETSEGEEDTQSEVIETPELQQASPGNEETNEGEGSGGNERPEQQQASPGNGETNEGEGIGGNETPEQQQASTKVDANAISPVLGEIPSPKISALAENIQGRDQVGSITREEVIEGEHKPANDDNPTNDDTVAPNSNVITDEPTIDCQNSKDENWNCSSAKKIALCWVALYGKVPESELVDNFDKTINEENSQQGKRMMSELANADTLDLAEQTVVAALYLQGWGKSSLFTKKIINCFETVRLSGNPYAFSQETENDEVMASNKEEINQIENDLLEVDAKIQELEKEKVQIMDEIANKEKEIEQAQTAIPTADSHIITTLSESMESLKKRQKENEKELEESRSKRIETNALLKTKTTENLTGKIELAEQEATLEEEQRELEAAKQLEERKEKEEALREADFENSLQKAEANAQKEEQRREGEALQQAELQSQRDRDIENQMIVAQQREIEAEQTEREASQDTQRMKDLLQAGSFQESQVAGLPATQQIDDLSSKDIASNTSQVAEQDLNLLSGAPQLDSNIPLNKNVAP
eukprot:g2839.t1